VSLPWCTVDSTRTNDAKDEIMSNDIYTQPMTTATRDRLIEMLGRKFAPKTAAQHAVWVVTHNMSEGMAADKVCSLETLEDWALLVAENGGEPAAPVAPKPDFEHGAFYMVGETVYRVKLGSRGFFYAEELVEGKFEYAPGAIRSIRVSDRMTLEQAQAYGIKTHHCACCGRELTNPESQERGIGPVCAAKYF
jgi:hypothetical protein